MKESKFEKKAYFAIYTIIVILISIALTNLYIYKNLKKDEVAFGKYNNNASSNISTLSNNIKNIREFLDLRYKGNIDEQAVVDGAIKGYIQGLGDPYTEYYTARQWEQLEDQLNGKYVGVGVGLTLTKEGQVEISEVYENTPAKKAGIEKGSKIVAVNGQNVKGLSLDEVAKLIQGPDDSSLTLTVSFNDQEKTVKLERKKITVTHVEGRMLDNNIGYIYITTFDSHAYDDFVKTYSQLEKQGMKKLIIDLRFNAGGDVEPTEKILDLFLDKGQTIYSTSDSKNNVNTIKAKNNAKYNIPVVLIANSESASASEIFIGALIDNNKAKFVGEKTYGKGVIQTVIPIKNGGFLKLTTEEYQRPNGQPINKVGIQPQIEQKISKDDIAKKVDSQLEKAIQEAMNM